MTGSTSKMWNKRSISLAPLAVAALLALVASAAFAGPALAHGKEVEIKISSFAPDPADPLTKLFRAVVTFKDGDPVEGATVLLETERQGGGPVVAAVELKPLSEPGVYAGQVKFPIFGNWETRLTVVGREEGEGAVSFIEEVAPSAPESSAAATREARERVLELFFSFNLGDIINILVRLSHTLGSIAVYGLSAMTVVAHLFLSPASKAMFFRRLSRVYWPVIAAGIVVLILSGVYAAAYGAPIKASGVFNIDVMWEIPYGPVYLGAILYKSIAFAISAVVMYKMAAAMRTAGNAIPPAEGASVDSLPMAAAVSTTKAATSSQLFRLAAVNTALGLSLIVAVVVVMYLHNLSHLAVFLPE